MKVRCIHNTVALFPDETGQFRFARGEEPSSDLVRHLTWVVAPELERIGVLTYACWKVEEEFLAKRGDVPRRRTLGIVVPSAPSYRRAAQSCLTSARTLMVVVRPVASKL